MARPYGNRRRPGHDRGRRDLTTTIDRGKFEGEPLVTEWAYETSLDGSDDQAGGEHCGDFAVLLRGPFLRSESRDWHDGFGQTLRRPDRHHIRHSAGCILYGSHSGFVSADWFPATPAGREQMQRQWDTTVAEYQHDSEA
jgi:hypothetical protein